MLANKALKKMRKEPEAPLNLAAARILAKLGENPLKGFELKSDVARSQISDVAVKISLLLEKIDATTFKNDFQKKMKGIDAFEEQMKPLLDTIGHFPEEALIRKSQSRALAKLKDENNSTAKALEQERAAHQADKAALATKKVAIAEKDAEIAVKEATLAAKDAEIAAKDALIATLLAQRAAQEATAAPSTHNSMPLEQEALIQENQQHLPASSPSPLLLSSGPRSQKHEREEEKTNTEASPPKKANTNSFKSLSILPKY